MTARGGVMLGLVVLLTGATGPAALGTNDDGRGAPGQLQEDARRGEPGITETLSEIRARDRRDRAPDRGRPVTLRRAFVGDREGPGSASTLKPAAGDSKAPPTRTGASFLATKGAPGPDSESTFIPPDTTGAVGPSDIVVPLNGRIKIFDKSGVQEFSADLSSFFASVLPGPPNDFAFDPRVEYDRDSGRWFVIAENGGADNLILIAVSSEPEISDQTGFTFFSFVHSSVPPAGGAGLFADHPTLGVDSESLLIGTNDFLPAGGYEGSSAFVIDKSELLDATPSVVGTAFRNIATGSPQQGSFTPQGVENDEPGSTESYFVGVELSGAPELNLHRVSYPGGVPTMSEEIDVAVPPWDVEGMGVPAQGSTMPIDGLDPRLFEAMIAGDPGSGEPRLWTAHSLQVDASGTASSSGGRLGSRWYELGSLAGTPSLVQAGTVFDAAAVNPDSIWVPSIAGSGQGHAVLGASIAGPTRFASVALTQRFAGEPPGAMSAPLAPPSAAGVAPYTVDKGSGRNRWGDYSQVSIDPDDNMTFWAFQEYVSAPNQWAVRVIEVRAPPPATPSSASPGIVPPGEPSVEVEITGASLDGSGFYDPGAGFADRIGATVGGGVVVNDITFVDPRHVTLDLDTTAATTGAKNVTVINPDVQRATGNELLTVAVPRTLTVDTAGIGSGTVTGQGISCPDDCTEVLADGAAVNLIAHPAAGSTFDGFTGDCVGSGCELTMDADKEVTATFGTGAGPGDGSASNDFELGKPKRNRKRGTAKLPVEVPGTGELQLAGKRVTRVVKELPGPGTFHLAVRPKGKLERRLDRRGSGKAGVEITFSPDGGSPRIEGLRIRLEQR